MSGHSKWSTIKHKKGIADAKRGKLFTKLGRAITVAAAKSNAKGLKAEYLMTNPVGPLGITIEKAKEASMPKENILRAIDRGTGEGVTGGLDEFTLEGYGPEGVAFLVPILTDNRNRTLAEIRKIFEMAGGSLGEAGSAAYVFGADPENPSFTIPVTDKHKVEQILRLVESLEDQDDVQEVFSNFDIPDELLEA
jgi:YebC/PmpR family DNA-binding regulatory protein